MRELTDEQRSKIKRYLTLDENQLYSLIAPYLDEESVTLYAPEGMLQAGKAFVDKIGNDLKKAVCEDFNWPAKRNDRSFDDTVTLVATIGDVITAYVGKVPPFAIAALLVKQGLDRLCK